MWLLHVSLDGFPSSVSDFCVKIKYVTETHSDEKARVDAYKELDVLHAKVGVMIFLFFIIWQSYFVWLVKRNRPHYCR